MKKINEVVTADEILEEVQKARISLNEASSDLNQLVQTEQKFTNYRGGMAVKAWLLGIAGIIMANMILGGFIRPYFFIVGLTGIALMLYVLYYIYTYPKKRVTQIVNEGNAIKSKILGIYSNTTSCIPTKYFFTEALDYISSLANTGRVNTLIDALNLTDTQISQWALEGKIYDIVNQPYDVIAIVNKEMWRW